MRDIPLPVSQAQTPGYMGCLTRLRKTLDTKGRHAILIDKILYTLCLDGEIKMAEVIIIDDEKTGDEVPLLDDKVLEYIMDLGARMLTAGGEVHRVEDTIMRLCHAYGAARADVFTITSTIAVTVYFDERPSLTQTRRVSGQRTDLTVLAQLNDISRRVCLKPCPGAELKRRLDSIPQSGNPLGTRIAIWALVSADFALFFGGSVMDAVCSGIIGGLLAILKNYLDKFLQNNYFAVIICGMAGSILGTMAAQVLPDISPFYINLGNIMLFIPGIALTTSIRDMFSGDTVSGMMKFVETILISLMIAWSFALFSERALPIIVSPAVWVQLVTCFYGTLLFGWMFHAEFRNALPSAAGGFCSWVLVLLVQELGFSSFVGYGIGAITLTMYSEFMARHYRAPATVFLTVGVIPLIPGRSLYTTMHYAMQQNWEAFLSQGLTTLLYAFSLAAGMIFVTVITRAISRQLVIKFFKNLREGKTD